VPLTSKVLFWNKWTKTEGETANPGSPGKQLLKQRWWSGGVNKRAERQWGRFKSK